MKNNKWQSQIKSKSSTPIVWIFDSNNIGRLKVRQGIAERITPNYITHNASNIDEILKDLPINDCPDILITAGVLTDMQEGIDAVKKINDRSSKKVFSVAVGGTDDFDLNVKLKNCLDDTDLIDKNTMVVVGMPHAITKEKIEIEKDSLGKRFSNFSEPRIVVLLGGDCAGFQFTSQEAQKMARELVNKTKEIGGSIILSTCHRTSPDAVLAFEKELKKSDIKYHLYDWQKNKGQNNPYPAMLSLADAVIVTGDSMSMCCEVNVSDKPIYIYESDNMRGIDTKLHNELYDKSLAKPFSNFVDKGVEKWQYKPLDTTKDIAEETLKRWRNKASNKGQAFYQD